MPKKSRRPISIGLVWSIIFLFFIIVSLFSYSILKEISKKNKIDKEIDSLKQEAEKIKIENMDLKERIAYLGSKDYQEMQAKEKLNLQDPNENLVIINQDLVKKEETTPAKNTKTTPPKKDIPNFIKWWNYFLKQ